jgi:hypothetical protein
MIIDRASGSSNITSDLHSGGVQFESRQGWVARRMIFEAFFSFPEKEKSGIILSCDWVTKCRFWIDNTIYWTLVQLVTTLHGSLSHTDKRSESRCLAAASIGGCSSVSWLTSLQGGDHLTLADFLCSLCAESKENTSSIVVCVDCLVMAHVWFCIYTAVAYQWLFLLLPDSSCQAVCHNILNLDRTASFYVLSNSFLTLTLSFYAM